MFKEEWRKIEGFSKYEVSNYGRIKSYFFGKEKIMKLRKNKDNYLLVNLIDDVGKKHTCQVHRLVGEAFIDKDSDDLEINHKNFFGWCNCVWNLEWVTHLDNMRHSYAHNRFKDCKIAHKKSVVCVETGVIYESTTSASIITNIDQGSISKVCNGIRHTAGGYHWEFVNG